MKKVAALGLALVALTGCADASQDHNRQDIVVGPSASPASNAEGAFTARNAARAQLWLEAHPNCPMAHCGVLVRVQWGTEPDDRDDFSYGWVGVVVTGSPPPVVLDHDDCQRDDENGDGDGIDLVLDAGDVITWGGDDHHLCGVHEWQLVEKDAIRVHREQPVRD